MSVNIHLVEMVKSAVGKKKTSRGESISFNSFDQSKLRDIERAAQKEELKTAAEVIEKLARVKTLEENFERSDFSDLEKEIKRILRK
ncbi:MAG: hypothetical protein WCF93_00190 [Candidatus Moraniibacteriota bacterium]